MTPEQLSRRLFGDLGQIMYALPYHHPTSIEARMPLRSLAFLSKPRGTYRVGVCETDHVWVYFERAPFATGDDPAVVPQRFELFTSYFVRDLALARQDRSFEEEERWPLHEACAVIDPRDARLVVASSEHEVVRGVELLAPLIDAARTGRSTAPLTCRDASGDSISEADCLREIGRLDPAAPLAVQLVGGCGRGEEGVYCVRTEYFDALETTAIVFRRRTGPGELLSIELTKPPREEF